LLSKEQLEEILGIALQDGGDFADVFVEEKMTNVVACEENKIERVNSGREAGVGIRVLSGESTAYAYTNVLSLAALKEAAFVASKAAVKNPRRLTTINLCKREPRIDFQILRRPEDVDIDEKVKTVIGANHVARSHDQRIAQVLVSYGDIIQRVLLANSEGDLIEDERIRTRFIILVVAQEGGVIQTGYEALGGLAGFELLAAGQPEIMAERAARQAVQMLQAKPAPAGRMPVIMAAEAGGTMIHEACGHGLEADLVQKELSVYRGKIGTKVAAETVTVIDDGTLANKYGSFRFDDEGTPSRKNILIENGILRSFMYDRLSARVEGHPLTGNGRRQSFAYRPVPRMTNTYIAPGNSDPGEIIEETEKGLLVKKMGGGQVNTTNGDFVFDVSEAYLIEKGKVTVPVRGATLTGNGPEVLQDIVMVGNDLGFGIGTCGKDGQGVPVSDAQPTISIKQLIVGSRAPVAPNGDICLLS
jgi:TldD protein